MQIEVSEDGYVDALLGIEPWRRGEVPEKVVSGIQVLPGQSRDGRGRIVFLLVGGRECRRHVGGGFVSEEYQGCLAALGGW